MSTVRNEVTEPALSEVAAAWEHHVATMKELRGVLESSELFKLAPAQRGMAYRQLIEVEAMAFNFCVGPRTAHPRVFRNTCWQTDFFCIGGNGPDFDYRMILLDGKHTYRLTGKVNDSRMILAQLNAGPPGSPNARCIGNYDFEDFNVREDGSFEVILSAKEHEGSWIKLPADNDYQWMIFRPSVETWDDVPAELTIERISPLSTDDPDSDEYSEAAVARRIGLATAYARYLIKDWACGFAPLVLRKGGGANKFIEFDSEEATEEGSPSARYLECSFEVGDDEALVLEFEREPNGTYWSLQLYDIWHRSLDFRTRQTTLNGRQMAKDADGKVRVVLSRRDPGVANWLDSAGYNHGEVTWRNYKVTRREQCAVHRVKFTDVLKHLPADTKKVTPEVRARELELRRKTYLRRHGE
ncbi:MAG: DUF1214 domain-containing protein [Steroidobacteraceae bacterium]